MFHQLLSASVVVWPNCKVDLTFSEKLPQLFSEIIVKITYLSVFNLIPMIAKLNVALSFSDYTMSGQQFISDQPCVSLP